MSSYARRSDLRAWLDRNGIPYWLDREGWPVTTQRALDEALLTPGMDDLRGSDATPDFSSI